MATGMGFVLFAVTTISAYTYDRSFRLAEFAPGIHSNATNKKAIHMWTVVLLVLSNIFMTFAWYGHLKVQSWPMWLAILASWGIAFFEYCLQVPANRWGYGHYGFSGAQLKITQEVITLVVFALFSVSFLGEPLRWNHLLAFALVVAAVVVIAEPWRPSPAPHAVAQSSLPDLEPGQQPEWGKPTID